MGLRLDFIATQNADGGAERGRAQNGGGSTCWSGAGQPLPDDYLLDARREEIDQQVLANLLRLNNIAPG